MTFDVRESVKDYYSEKIKKRSDLKTEACCTDEPLPPHISQIIPLIDEEITTKYYGCGVVIPYHIKGLKVLDVGCGTGRDCYIMSKLVGEDGSVYGIDMTESQLEIANRHINEHTERFGYRKPNLTFILDYMENIGRHFEECSLDLVTSNCVINLAEDKAKILNEIYRVLKYGGEFYFSDVYADRRIPDHLRHDPVLYGECLGGALYYRDFERLARDTGFKDPRIVSKKILNIDNENIKRLTGDITFFSITYRLWKLEGLEDGCEDYGHTATYLGNLDESPSIFELDRNHVFRKGISERVCGNTALMLSQTRFREFFRITGDFTTHLGRFDCGAEAEVVEAEAGGSCC